MSLTNGNVATIDEPIVYATEENWTPVTDKGYEFYDEYSDENAATMDEMKIITLSPKQINITQESNSQYIPFRINRFYDGYDLTKAKLQIYFVNRQGQYGINFAVDVYYNEDTIKFAWLVDSSATSLDGKLKFELQGEGVNSKGYKYLWKSQPNTEMNIIKSLQGKSFIQPDDSWQETFFTKIDKKLAEADKAVQEAQAAANESKAHAENADGSVDECQKIADNLAQMTIDSLKGQIEEQIQEIIDESFETVINDTINTKVNEALNSYYSEMTATLVETQDYIGIN